MSGERMLPRFGDVVEVGFPTPEHPKCVWFEATVVDVSSNDPFTVKVDFQGWRQEWWLGDDWRYTPLTLAARSGDTKNAGGSDEPGGER